MQKLDLSTGFYYLGGLCKRGHNYDNTGQSLRYRANNTCVLCSAENSINRDRKWNEENPEKLREAKRKWRERNLEKAKESQKRWRENNPDYFKKYHRENKEKYREKKNESQRRYYAKRRGNQPDKPVRTPKTKLTPQEKMFLELTKPELKGYAYWKGKFFREYGEKILNCAEIIKTLTKRFTAKDILLVVNKLNLPKSVTLLVIEYLEKERFLPKGTLKLIIEKTRK